MEPDFFVFLVVLLLNFLDILINFLMFWLEYTVFLFFKLILVLECTEHCLLLLHTIEIGLVIQSWLGWFS